MVGGLLRAVPGRPEPFPRQTERPASLFVAGSVWTQDAHTLIGIAVSLDEQPVI